MPHPERENPRSTGPAPDRWEAASDELWTEVLARLLQALQACAEPQALRRLQGDGIRRPRTVARILAREYAEARRIALSAGTRIDTLSIERQQQAFAPGTELDQHFSALAAAYLRLLQALAPDAGSPLERWLKGRAQVHLAQAQAASAVRADRGKARDPPGPAALHQSLPANPTPEKERP